MIGGLTEFCYSEFPTFHSSVKYEKHYWTAVVSGGNLHYDVDAAQVFRKWDMHFKPFVFVLCVFLVACSQLIAQETKNRKVDKQRVDEKDLPLCDRKLTYKTVAGKSFQLHIFEAGPNLPANDNRAAIVFFFGGGWNNGDPKQFYSQCRALADLGMVAMSAEYRVASRDQSKVIDCICDAQDAIAFVREGRPKYFETRDAMIAFLSELKYFPAVKK